MDPYNGLYTFIQENSLKIDEWRQPDILYLDSLHTTEQVFLELEKYGPTVKHGGYILLHDVTKPEGDDGSENIESQKINDGVSLYLAENPHLKYRLVYGRCGLGVISIP